VCVRCVSFRVCVVCMRCVCVVLCACVCGVCCVRVRVLKRSVCRVWR
jgi:hypothetical protein